MTVPSNTISPGNGLCWYGMQKLPALLEAFTREITGVKEAQDSEYIHRMRVASRRLRAALPLFQACFPKKQYQKWMREITGITRTLGEARDTDVQIAFLQKSQKKLLKDAGLQNHRLPGDQPTTGPALQYLLAALQKKRGFLQTHVLSSLADLEKSLVTDEMNLAFMSLNREFAKTRKKPNVYGLSPVAALRIRKRISSVLSYEPWVLHPEAVAEHHATRIAAKKLRYTLEVYGALYRNNLEKPIARIKKMQEILGDIHDCDVWIEHITTILLRERTLLRAGKGTKRPAPAVLASLRLLLHEREAERKRKYRQFVRYWQLLGRTRLWDELRMFLDTGRKTRFRLPATYPEEEAAVAVTALAGIHPGIMSHSRQVTNLALMVFDSLQSLHNLPEHDRFLLGCAGELHDIGWKYGQRGHNRRGAEMVFMDETLPFDLEERGILSSIILLHRGKVRPVTIPYLELVSPKSRQKTLMLAAILRVADGLDYLHTGSVRVVRCILSAEGVLCTVTASGDTSAEIIRAQSKADLFVQVFEKSMVIR